MRHPLCLALLAACAWPGHGLDVDSGLTPQHAVMADFDRDGRGDLAVANAFDDRVNIHLQNELGEFLITQSVRVGINPSSPSNFPRFLLITDINHDQYPDLIVLCSGQFSFGAEPSVQTLLNERDGGFVRMPAQPSTGSFTAEEFPVQFAQGEFTGDNYLDLAICNLDGKSIQILEGSGSGLFEAGQKIPMDVSGEGPQDLTVFDGDQDGLDDLWVVTGNSFLVLRQSGPGAFAAPSAFPLSEPPIQLRALVLDDLNGDGEIDAALADAGGKVHLAYGIDVFGSLGEATTVTDPSLSGCSDIVSLLWDSDTKPDLAVSNRTGDSVSVLLSTGGLENHPTGKSPRRIEAGGDFDGDGRFDLITANEGDGADPGNPDITLISNPSHSSSNIQISYESEKNLNDRFGLDIPAAQGLSVPEDQEAFWLIDSTRRFLIETDANGVERTRIEIPFEIGGVHLDDEGQGFLVERGAPRIHAFEIEMEDDDEGLELEIDAAFVYAPGEIGFSGLAYDDDQDEFFVSAPGVGRILRIDEDGEILAEILTEIPAWDLAWDGDRDRLLTVNPGRSEFRAYTRDGTLDAVLTEDLSESHKFFDSVGVSGVSWSEEQNRVFLLTTPGAIFGFTSGSVSSPIPVSPSSQFLDMGYSIDWEELFILGSDGFFYCLGNGGSESFDRFSIWPAIQALADYVPAAISYDDNADEVLIPDRVAPFAARFNRSGDFLGFRDLSLEVGSIEGPFLGFDLSPSGSGSCFRTRSHLHYGPPSAAQLIRLSETHGLSWLPEGVFLPGCHPGELIYMKTPDTMIQQRIAVEDLTTPLLLSSGPPGFIFLLKTNTLTLETRQIEIQSGHSHWDLYE